MTPDLNRTARLPDGMKDCTIEFKECHLGHGRLTATNWIDHGCPQCEIERLKQENERLKTLLASSTAGVFPTPQDAAEVGDNQQSKMFDYISGKATGRVAELEAQLEHMMAYCVAASDVDIAVAATIERCAQVVAVFDECDAYSEEDGLHITKHIAAAIRRLKIGDEITNQPQDHDDKQAD